jgi:hypothetical protein
LKITAECGFTFRFAIPIFHMQRKVAQKNNDCKQMFIAATQKTGYDIAVHKSQTKTGGRQYGFQRKVKADKKERGQAVWIF